MDALSPFGQTSTNATLIRSPNDMAKLLHTSCPEQAFAYALAAHEKACFNGDDTRTAFWAEVVHLLSPDDTSIQQVA